MSFQASRAVRQRVPLLFGLYGQTGSGKTFSAHRLAQGVRRVTGGRVKFIDTENGRALHYADDFDFDHIPFAPPFSPRRYLEALRYAASLDEGPIVVDSGSHEHEGQGGVLMMHNELLDQRYGAEPKQGQEEWKWQKERDKGNFAAWIKPKAQRQELINGILQLGRDVIFCFRAKEKIKPVAGGSPKEMGWMPICGEELAYEMTALGLLLPNAMGIPTWTPGNNLQGEANMIKLPRAFRERFDVKEPKPLSEDDGEFLARWAQGGATKAAAPLTDQQAAECLWKALDTLGKKKEDKLAWLAAKVGRGVAKLSDLTRPEIEMLISVVPE